MDDEVDRARRLDQENRERFAIRREEREMAAEEHELDKELEDLDDDVERAERRIDDELRREHWGHEPEHRPSWRRTHGEPPDGSRGGRHGGR